MECKCPLLEITIEQKAVQQQVNVLKVLTLSGRFPTPGFASGWSGDIPTPDFILNLNGGH